MTAESTWCSVPAAGFARVVALARRPKSEGAGNAGCLSHPQPCVHMKKARKQVTTGTPKQSGIPCPMVLRLASCSRRSAGLDSLRRPGFMTRGLIPASGDHDHTTSPSALGLRSSAQPGRPSHPAPRFVTIAKRPPGERGMARPYNWFGLPKKRNIFRSRPWHDFGKSAVGQISSGRARLVGLSVPGLALSAILLVDIDRDIREQEPAALAALDHDFDGIEQLPGRSLGFVEFAGRLEILPGDHEGRFDELRNPFHVKPTPPRIKRSRTDARAMDAEASTSSRARNPAFTYDNGRPPVRGIRPRFNSGDLFGRDQSMDWAYTSLLGPRRRQRIAPSTCSCSRCASRPTRFFACRPDSSGHRSGPARGRQERKIHRKARRPERQRQSATPECASKPPKPLNRAASPGRQAFHPAVNFC